MKYLRWLIVCGIFMGSWPASAQSGEFSFGVIAHAFRTSSEESVLQDAIFETNADNLAFVVANGIKSSTEPCSDQIYNRRKLLLNGAKNGLILSMAASDWTDCKSENGKSAAMERLSRLRDLFFTGGFSLGASKIPLVRQSAIPKFRSYSENARWQFRTVLFASINLPANNNHYLRAAGRNSEFEDRLVANRDWLQRLFTIASRRKLAAIVLFCEGNPLFKQNSLPDADLSQKRDGFAETRRAITALAAKFPGKVLIVHSQNESEPASSNTITWHGNLGEVNAGTGWAKFTVNPASPAFFSIDRKPAVEQSASP